MLFNFASTNESVPFYAMIKGDGQVKPVANQMYKFTVEASSNI